jgi:hypothetical protein
MRSPRHRHIIQSIIGAEIDNRDKVLQTLAPALRPVAVTYCGERILLNNRQRIERLGDGGPMLLCDECLANLPLIRG